MNTRTEAVCCSNGGLSSVVRHMARLLFATLVCVCVSNSKPAAQAAFPHPVEPGLPNTLETQYLAIPAAAFHPKLFNYSYTNTGRKLTHLSAPEVYYGEYFAPLQLPDGSSIQKVTFYYDDLSVDDNCHLTLYQSMRGDVMSITPIALLHSGGYGGSGSDSTTDVWGPILVENYLYDYYFLFQGHPTVPSQTDLISVRVDYTLPAEQPEDEYLDIAPATFVPYSEGLAFRNEGWRLDHYNLGGGPIAHFQAPVLLPDGATVEEAKFYYFDQETSVNAEAHLHRTDLAGSWDPALAMADLYSSGDSGWGSDSALVSRYSTIQNSNNAYWVYYALPETFVLENTIYGRGFTIRFQRGTPGPLEAVSIPAAAFTPRAATQTFENNGRFLKQYTGGSGSTYVAPLYLPHGKTIRRMRFYYERGGTPDYDASAWLLSYPLHGGSTSFHVLLSSSGSGWRSTDSGVLNGLRVDNMQRAYWLEWILYEGYNESDFVRPSGVVVEVADGDWFFYLPIVRR